MDSFVDTVTDGLIEGRMQFKDFAEAILREIMRIMIAKSIAGIAETALGGFNFGGSATGAAGASGGGSSSFFQLGGQYQSSLFADGGIMTKWGKANLKQYANGGIARSPQVAIFGEGSTPEAYVPLPDGRTIPVTLQGELSASKSADQPQTPVVNVNVINQSSQEVNAEQQGARFDGEQFVVDVVLKNISRPGPIRDAVRNVQ